MRSGGAHPAAYALIPRCSSQTFPGLQEVTIATSHELLEASTDPHPQSRPAFNTTDDANAIWQLAPGGELGDMCEVVRAAYQPLVGQFMAQRMWSNASAAAGHDPCVPQPPTDVYFNAAPVMNDTIVFGGGGFQANVKGVKIAEGASKTIDVEIFSDAPTDPITVKAHDYSQLIGGTPHLSFDLDANEGKNGQTLHLTITVDTASKNKSELFLLTSDYSGQQNWWVGVVGQ